MSKLRTASAVPQNAPVLGMNTKDALPSIPDGYSPWLLNVDCENRFVRARNGIVVGCNVSAEDNILALGVYGTKAAPSTYKLYAYSKNSSGTHKIYDVSTSSASLVHTCADDTPTVVMPFNFNSRLAFVGDSDFADCDRVWDGSSWASLGFTYSGSPIGGVITTSFRGRPYIASGKYLYYPTAIGAVTGALNRSDLSSVFDGSDNIAFMGTLSAPGERAIDTYLVIGNQSGEVLIYGGENPASSTWSIVSQFKISPPLGYQAILTFRNDIWVLTEVGAVSIRQLFTQGAEAADLYTKTDAIDDYWIKLVKNLAGSYWNAPARQISACFWPERNKVLIMMLGHVDVDGVYDNASATIFSYNCTTQAWSIHKVSQANVGWMGGLTYYNGTVYFIGYDIVMKISLTGFKDEQLSSPGNYNNYPFSIHGPYSTIFDLAANKKIAGFKPIFKTDFAGTNINMKAASDMGRKVSAASKANTLLDGYNNPYYSVGAEGDFIQWRLEGNTDTASADGLELYALSAVVEPGGVR